MENNGFVNSLMSGSRKSSIFCEARITELSFLRTRFMALRIYSMAARLLRKRYAYYDEIKKSTGFMLRFSLMKLASNVYMLVNAFSDNH